MTQSIVRLLATIALFGPITSWGQDGHISIHLKSGYTFTTHYAFLSNNTSSSPPFVRIDAPQGQKISIGEVDHIAAPGPSGTDRYFQPVIAQGRKQWGERTFQSERISIFYSSPTKIGWGYTHESRYYYYSKDQGPLRKVRFHNLHSDLQDNATSMHYLKKSQHYGVAQRILCVVGGFIVMGGIAQGLASNDESDSNNNLAVPGTILLGAATLSIPLILHGPKKKHMINALKAYE